MARILVADDEQNIRLLLRRVLERAGHTVAEAANGNQALELLGRMRFDLVILDVVMPGKGGIETLIEARDDNRDLKVIVISGKVDTTSQAFQNLASHFGASRIVSKPFEPADIIRDVEELTGGKRA